MPVGAALAEWRRVLRPGGHLGFSTMRSGNPRPARLFRRLARVRGLELPDPAAESGTETACTAVLSAGGFDRIRIRGGTVRFSTADLARAWEVHALLYGDLLTAVLDSRALRDMEAEYRAALARSPESVRADVLYATAVAPCPAGACSR